MLRQGRTRLNKHTSPTESPKHKLNVLPSVVRHVLSLLPIAYQHTRCDVETVRSFNVSNFLDMPSLARAA